MRHQLLRRRFVALALSLSVFFGFSTSATAQIPIDECGTIINQPFGGCNNLFQSDSGLVFQDNTGSMFGGAAVGDVIHVSGMYNALCITFCAIDGCITQLTISPCIPPSAGTPYCFGDGTATACPCGNNGAAGEGCGNSSGVGGTLVSTGSASVALDDLGFDASGLLTSQPALLFSGQVMVGGGSGMPFGDGLRCAGTNVVRLGTQVPDAAGDASWSGGLAASGGWTAGDTRFFQGWYRDPIGSPCSSGFNLTHGVGVTFAP